MPPLAGVRVPRSSLRIAAAAATLTILVAGACNESERVDLDFRAREGSRFVYEVTVSSTVVTALADAPQRRTDTVHLTVEQEVVAVQGDLVGLTVTVRRHGHQSRRFEVRVDTEAGAATVERVEGLPAETLGELDGSRLLLLASGLLPADPVRPGEAWDIERVVDVPGGGPELRGSGRLVRLEARGDVALAHVRTSTELPVDATLALPDGRARVQGTEITDTVASYAVEDGTLHHASSRTSGRFDLMVEPPAGRPGAPVRGSLEIDVESTSRRVEPAG